jgi:hypothetical protein
LPALLGILGKFRQGRSLHGDPSASLTPSLRGSALGAPILTFTRRRFRSEVQQVRGSDQSSFKKEFLGNSLERGCPYLYRSTL